MAEGEPAESLPREELVQVLAAVRAVARASGPLEYGRVLAALLSAVVDSLGVDAAAIYLLDETATRLVFAGDHPPIPPMGTRHAEIPIEGSITDRHVQSLRSHAYEVEELGGRAPSAARVAELERQVAMLTRELARKDSERATLSHETRALLAVMLGFACNMRDGLCGELTAEQRVAVERIVAATQNAAALLERAPPSASAPHSARRGPQRVLVQLDRLVTDTTALFAEVARDARVTLGVEYTEPLAVWCDPVQVKQAVVNLVVNALKFTPTGGKVEVLVERSAPSRPQGFEARTSALVIVKDSGPGVHAADRERIFERGVRLARDAAVAGRGIGLSVVRDVAADHRGSVRVEDSPLGGAAFILKLPIDLRRREADAVRGDP